MPDDVPAPPDKREPVGVDRRDNPLPFRETVVVYKNSPPASDRIDDGFVSPRFDGQRRHGLRLERDRAQQLAKLAPHFLRQLPQQLWNRGRGGAMNHALRASALSVCQSPNRKGLLSGKIAGRPKVSTLNGIALRSNVKLDRHTRQPEHFEIPKDRPPPDAKRLRQSIPFLTTSTLQHG